MNWPRALATWLLIVIAESINGTVRQLFIAPTLGDLPARQVGLLIGSAIIFAISMACIRWIGARSFAEQFNVGLLWVVLIVIFEFSLGAALGNPWESMLSDYNIAEGGYMPFGLLFLLFAPALAAKARGLGQ
jgi:hypothetical protein